MAIHRGRISDATKAKYNQIRYNVRQLNDNTEDTRQQMSYREYRDQLEQGYNGSLCSTDLQNPADRRTGYGK